MAEINTISNNSNLKGKASFVFLFLVILLTSGLYFYNSNVESNIEDIKIDILSKQSSIDSLKKDKNIQIYSLLELNKKYINSSKKMNKITKYIDHLGIIGLKYGLKIEGFNLSKGIISTNIKSESDDKGIAYEKLRDFIKKYRNDDKALFELDFINSIAGTDLIKFRANFKIK